MCIYIYILIQVQCVNVQRWRREKDKRWMKKKKLGCRWSSALLLSLSRDSLLYVFLNSVYQIAWSWLRQVEVLKDWHHVNQCKILCGLMWLRVVRVWLVNTVRTIKQPRGRASWTLWSRQYTVPDCLSWMISRVYIHDMQIQTGWLSSSLVDFIQ